MWQVFGMATHSEQHQVAIEHTRIRQARRRERPRTRCRTMILEWNRKQCGAAPAAQSCREREAAVTDVDDDVGYRTPDPERMVGMIHQQHRRPAGNRECEGWNDVPHVRMKHYDISGFPCQLAQRLCALEQ